MNESIQSKLRPHQVEPVRALSEILPHSNAVDFSDTGTGKTYVAAAVAKSLGLPTLVVAPKIVLTAWRRAAAHFGDTVSAVNYEMVRTGNTPLGRWSNPKLSKSEPSYKCQSCQQKVDVANAAPCPVHHAGIHCVVSKTVPHNYGHFIWHPEIEFLVFDEAHRCGGLGSLNEELLLAARRQNIRTLALSATAACSPLQFRALGNALDLFRAPDFYRWARRHGCGKLPTLPGFRVIVGEERLRGIMAGIREQIIPAKGVAVSTRDIPGFPERTITAELYDIENPEALDSLYEQMGDALAALARTAESDADPEHPLTKLLRLRQRIELLKVPVFVELANDAVARGNSVGIFVNFSATIAELSARLNTDCIIDGAGVANREKHIDDFQSERERILIANSQAGGVGVDLPDKTGRYPRLGLVSPPQSAVIFRQLCGRFHRSGAKSNCSYRIVLAANTVEEKVKRGLDTRLSAIDALNDADFVP